MWCDGCKMCQSWAITDKRCLKNNYKSSWRMYGYYTIRARSIMFNRVCIVKHRVEREREIKIKRQGKKKKHDSDVAWVWIWFWLKNIPLGMQQSLLCFLSSKKNIEAGYYITENNKQNGSDITVEVRGQDEPRMYWTHLSININQNTNWKAVWMSCFL